MPSREITYAEALREAMREEMKKDPQVFLLGEDIGVYGGAFGVTQGLIEEFGPRELSILYLRNCHHWRSSWSSACGNASGS